MVQALDVRVRPETTLVPEVKDGVRDILIKQKMKVVPTNTESSFDVAVEKAKISEEEKRLRALKAKEEEQERRAAEQQARAQKEEIEQRRKEAPVQHCIRRQLQLFAGGQQSR